MIDTEVVGLIGVNNRVSLLKLMSDPGIGSNDGVLAEELKHHVSKRVLDDVVRLILNYIHEVGSAEVSLERGVEVGSCQDQRYG